jgi:hemerythrin
VEWSAGFEVGIKQIDKQHKHFVGIMNKLFDAMQTSDNTAVPKIIDELVAYAQLHFATEQGLFIKYKYSKTDEHVAEHKRIQAKVNAFLTKKYDDQFKLGYELLDLVEDWLFKHVATMDKEYAKELAKEGLS